jgi:hypothetical protein
MSNAEEYYHTAYDLHMTQLTSLRKQVKILEEVLELDALQADLKDAIRSGDTARIEAAKIKYDEYHKANKKIRRQLVFWKTVAVLEGVVIIVLSATTVYFYIF